MTERLPALAACALLVWCAPVRADEASGTWTGELEGRGNYYWERSTRVIVPEAKLSLSAPNGIHGHAEYLVDVISSASIGQGVTEDSVVTELRHGVGLGLGKELELGGCQLELGLRGMYSTEDDYRSWIYGLQTALSWDERNTKLSLGLSRVEDEISANNDPSFAGELQGLTVALGLERVINEVITLSVGYQVAQLEGYLGNAYRRVVFEGGAPLREQPPGDRTRHNASARVAFFVRPAHGALHLGYRAYMDSWDVAALTPELRWYQELGDELVLALGYRFYVQSRARFARPSGRYPGDAADNTGPTTNDPKLLAMQSHTLGLLAEHELSFLEDTFLSFASAASIDLRVDRYWSNTSFGNGVLATLGGRLPF